MNYDEIYDEEYYLRYVVCPEDQDNVEQGYYHKLMENVHQAITSEALNLLGPKTLLDVGCAFNYAVKFARDVYDIEAWGVDVSSYAYTHSSCPDYHVLADCSKPLDFDGKLFELVMCIEVAEHLTEEDSHGLLNNLTNLSSKYILFSSDSVSEMALAEPTHINMQPESYWIKQFEKRGFVKYEHFVPPEYIPHSILLLNKEILK